MHYSGPKYLVTVPWKVNPDKESTATFSVAPLSEGATVTINIGKTPFIKHISPSKEQSIHVLPFNVSFFFKRFHLWLLIKTIKDKRKIRVPS